jgi:carbamoyltransferase
MAAVLGVSAHYHDAAAALIVDGRLVAAMQEERFSRIKNDPSLPRQAIAACLRVGGLEARALDRVVFYEDPFAKLERVLVSLLVNFPRSFRQFPRALASQLGGKLWVLDQLAELLRLPRAKVAFEPHHLCHAASAFYAGPFSRAAVLTVDGVGEAVSTALWRGGPDGLRCERVLEYPHSLGLLYAAVTAWLGFTVNEGEYKVMGLSAFGTPRFMDEMRRLVRVAEDGSFTLDLRYFAHGTDVELGFSPALEQLLGPRRAPGRPWRLDESEEDRRYADVAASLQRATEEALLALARAARAHTGEDALCLAGGVALNAVANARLAAESGFSRLFVQPAAGDAGGALGAALLGALALGDRPEPMTTCALGEAVNADEVPGLAERLGLSARRVEDGAAEVARRLAREEVVGVVQGPFEWGPRALGQRSILAAPGRAATRERLNRLVKRREPFRPFAPAVAARSVGAWFPGAPSELTVFMTTVCRVPEERRAALAAVTHVDGTARVQTVTPEAAPHLARVVDAFEREGGVPVVLNTSLNGPGEPIVASAADALALLIACPIDALWVGDFLVERGER